MKWFVFQFEENDVDPPSPQKKIQKEGMVRGTKKISLQPIPHVLKMLFNQWFAVNIIVWFNIKEFNKQ